MNSGVIYLRKYDWQVTIMLDVGCEDYRHVAQMLNEAGASGEYIMSAVKKIVCGQLNQGLTYSGNGKSVSVIGRTTTQAERINTITHELYHVVCHICNERELQMCSEDAAWLMGDLNAELYRLINYNQSVFLP